MILHRPDLDEGGLENVGLVGLLKKLVIRWLSAFTLVLQDAIVSYCRSKVDCKLKRTAN